MKRPYTVLEKDRLYIITPDGKRKTLDDERVKVVFPSMGQFGSQCLSAAFRYYGVRSDVCPPPDVEEFKLGRGNSLSKECLPLQLTLGSLIKYVKEKANRDEIVLYFMPETMGPCRFGQYSVFMNLWLDRNNVENVTLFGLNSENAYAGLGTAFRIRAWLAVVVSDVFFDVERGVMTLARIEKKQGRLWRAAKKRYCSVWRTILFESSSKRSRKLQRYSRVLKREWTTNTLPGCF